jgi:hypothetical protein
MAAVLSMSKARMEVKARRRGVLRPGRGGVERLWTTTVHGGAVWRASPFSYGSLVQEVEG